MDGMKASLKPSCKSCRFFAFIAEMRLRADWLASPAAASHTGLPFLPGSPGYGNISRLRGGQIN